MDATGSLSVAFAETHTAVVWFVGERAYKVKKPVRFPFLDFSTRRLRERACRREVDLNRRMAPDVYLGVATLTEPDSVAPSEHVVVMRRMPADRSLARLVLSGDGAVLDHVRQIARTIEGFHAGALRDETVARAGTVHAIRGRWRDNFDELVGYADAATAVFDHTALRTAQQRVEAFLEGRRDLFEHRVDAGFVCDGHGDLQAADIYCLDDGPRILDCIEFDDELRWVDVADDVAFLVMDLEHLGAHAAGVHLQRCYEEFAGHPLPAALLHHYVAYRALVRAKVSAARWVQERTVEPSAADETLATARGLFGLCLDHLDAARVRLVVVGGLPGTGKTTLAQALGSRRGWTVLRSDVIRKERLGLDPSQRVSVAFEHAPYDRATTEATYAALLADAGVMLRMGESVVVDASWNSAADRQLARRLAADCHADLAEIRCDVEPDVAVARMRERTRLAADASDATPEIAAQLATTSDPWPEAITLRTDRPAEELATDLDLRL